MLVAGCSTTAAFFLRIIKLYIAETARSTKLWRPPLRINPEYHILYRSVVCVQNYDDLNPRGKPMQKVLREANNMQVVQEASTWREIEKLHTEWLQEEHNPGSRMAGLAVEMMLRLAKVSVTFPIQIEIRNDAPGKGECNNSDSNCCAWQRCDSHDKWQ